MSTGLLIRDFVKRERELRYENSGSIGFSEIEHNAYRLSLTIQVTHLDGVVYENLKTLPWHSHYGYATLFRGSTVTENIAIKFPKFRVFDIVNHGIWAYHQHTENIHVLDEIISLYGFDYHSAHLALAEGEPIGGLPTRRKIGMNFPDTSPEGQQAYWAMQLNDITEESGYDSGYRAYPIASPFPDICKFKSDIPASFLFRLEAWYLVNPLVYVVDNPTDSSDATDDESEYPTPDTGDGDGDGDSFPPSSGIPSGRDPRDFNGGNTPDYPPGSQVRVTYTKYAYAPGCQKVTETHVVTLPYFGTTEASISFISSVNGCDGPQTPVGLVLNMPGVSPVELVWTGEQQYKLATVDSVQVILP